MKNSQGVYKDVSCIILAGGRSKRLGHNKFSITIGNETLLERVISTVSSLGSETIIVSAPGKSLAEITGKPDIKIVADIYPGLGPLGGLHTGLSVSNSFRNLVVACDMPFLNPRLLGHMISISVGFDVVMPRVGKLIEPLHAVYTKRCLELIEKQINNGIKKMSELLGLVSVRYVEDHELRTFDDQRMSFFNINTKEDLNLARQIASSKEGYAWPQ
jgi:molybdopterin-guanine dinucleotide biosynthesis protein A